MNATVGSCLTATCYANSDCTAGPDTCGGSVQGSCRCGRSSDCGGGACNGRVAGTCTTPTCYLNSDCSHGLGCTGNPQEGTCQANACSSNAQCHGTEQCIGGTCNGCFQSSDCPGSTSQCVGGTPPGTCTGTRTNFPFECIQGPLNPQEAALEFLFFDLSACVSPDNSPPPGPPMPVVSYYPETFTADFTSSCPAGTHVGWRQVQWQATIPSTASIVFAGQTADPAADGGLPNYTGVQSVQLADATTTTPNLPTGWSAALIDVASTDGGSAPGAFNNANPVVTSKGDLRLTITLNPTTNKSQAPTLIQWQVISDCPPSE
jgi:hypothetical protein